ncbi:AAA family ATPase [Pseudoxanthomonas taiwanensis]|uniref:AAA family ATPase n=1 Tax=Pseudoxanthomonas taiwanensis TaxID=176598 RepID=A0A921P2H5_9GAMM|nr:AAA family ATPase [Pseudoxanthomonas taiwanensis]KAF1690193.1 AAA family ATPase [Pseudoxanthomonas taiwanensis]
MSATIEEQARAALDGVRLTPASAIRCQPIRWLWPGWLARGKLHVLAGAPGTGKTTAALALAATITRGGRWPDGTVAPPGRVLVWSGEDDPADTLVPRLRAAGADLGRVLIVGDTLTEEEPRPFDPARDIQALEWQLDHYDDVALLIADPVVSAVSGDSHKNTEVRRALQPLVNLGQRLDCAVLGISHFSKGSAGRDPIERVTGSIAFGALARVVLVTAKGEDGDRLLARAKSNIGPDGGGFRYTLEQIAIGGGMEASRVSWGEALEGTARELLGAAEQQDDEHVEQHDAVDWLKEVLSAGPMPVKDVKKQADEAGFAWRTVQRAMRRAGVDSRRGGFGQPATWRLCSRASKSTVAPFAPHPESGATGATGATDATVTDIAAMRERILARFGSADDDR